MGNYELACESRGSNSINSARGRILYNFPASACEGLHLGIQAGLGARQLGEGKVTLSDLRSTSWEDARARAIVSRSIARDE